MMAAMGKEAVGSVIPTLTGIPAMVKGAEYGSRVPGPPLVKLGGGLVGGLAGGALGGGLIGAQQQAHQQRAQQITAQQQQVQQQVVQQPQVVQQMQPYYPQPPEPDNGQGRKTITRQYDAQGKLVSEKEVDQ